MSRIRVEEFTADHLEAAGQLLAARHRQQRSVEPLLEPLFEDPEAAGREVATTFGQLDASGTAAVVDGRLAGFLIGAPRAGAAWGPNVWVGPAGHAVEEPEVARDLYAHAAARWVVAGRASHYVVLPAPDAHLVDAWFRLGFGQQHVHAVRETGNGKQLPLPAEVSLRRAERRDVEPLSELELLLDEHQSLSPVFSPGPGTTLEEARAEWEEAIDDRRNAAFVVLCEERVVGAAFGCPVELSRAHSGCARPNSSALLAFAAVRPEWRAQGIGACLGWRVVDWARESGYRSIAVDWRATNLLSSRTWPKLGFRTTFLRLFRRV